MDSNTRLAFATESKDDYNVDMLEPHYMVNDAITQPHTPSMHGFLSIDEAGTSSILYILIVDLVYSFIRSMTSTHQVVRDPATLTMPCQWPYKLPHNETP
jgi:hypothetical protein